MVSRESARQAAAEPPAFPREQVLHASTHGKADSGRGEEMAPAAHIQVYLSYYSIGRPPEAG